MQKNKPTAPVYKLEDTQYAPDITPQAPAPPVTDEDAEGHLWFKKALCGDNLFGNIFYPLWRDATCHCCSFMRGALVGYLTSTAVHYILSKVF